MARMPLNRSGTKQAAETACMYQPPGDEDGEGRRAGADERAGEEGRLGDEHHFAGLCPLDEAGGDGSEGAHYQQEAGGQPLHGGFVHGEVVHDRGEGDIEQGVVEVAEEGANEEGGDDGFGGKAGA